MGGKCSPHSSSMIGTYRGNVYHNYLKNIQGSTASIVDEDVEATAVYSYTDFGETEEVVADSIDNEICYTGAIYDKDTGLYYMNARYYDAVTGRFISQDSYRGGIDDTKTWHLYAYCANNPINYVDPTGHAILSVGVDVSYYFYLGSYKTFAVAIDGNKNFKLMLSAGAVDNSSGANASIAVVACLYMDYNSVNKLSNGFGISVSSALSLGKYVSGSAGIDISGKNHSITISGSVGKTFIPADAYLEVRAGVTAVSSTYSLSNIAKNYKVDKGFSTTVKGKKIKIIRKKNGVQVSTTNFPKKINVLSSSKIKVV